ncbi:hypothetical protein GH741_20450 [Aquibacillus halophilus]|uniref:Uncharacterized protein n=1 Tax=Aquibacillus halophilus TaxID=930132 RepID=A0A6A8DPN0_9BACI|nr:hypothetical protein [Aquibacillus halophilus]MRH45017.1 hypothetical protein [Aquibacillus halophilus]
MEKIQSMLSNHVFNMETAIIYLVIFVFAFTIVIPTISRIILLFLPLPKQSKKIIGKIVMLMSLAIAVLVWWQAVLPLA